MAVPTLPELSVAVTVNVWLVRAVTLTGRGVRGRRATVEGVGDRLDARAAGLVGGGHGRRDAAAVGVRREQAHRPGRWTRSAAWCPAAAGTASTKSILVLLPPVAFSVSLPSETVIRWVDGREEVARGRDEVVDHDDRVGRARLEVDPVDRVDRGRVTHGHRDEVVAVGQRVLPLAGRLRAGRGRARSAASGSSCRSACPATRRGCARGRCRPARSACRRWRSPSRSRPQRCRPGRSRWCSRPASRSSAPRS